jgi:hypothetical protein
MVYWKSYGGQIVRYVRQVILLRLPAQHEYMCKQTFLYFPNIFRTSFLSALYLPLPDLQPPHN